MPVTIHPRTLFLGIAAAFAALALLGAGGSHLWPHAFHGAHGILLPALFYVGFTIVAFRFPAGPACPACAVPLTPAGPGAFCANCGAPDAGRDEADGRKSQASAPPRGAP